VIIPRLALRNLLGGRLRTVLNVLVLSFSYVAIVLFQGLYRGMDEQVSRVKIESEYGRGQYWQADYDALDPLSIESGHAVLPPALAGLVDEGRAAAVLIVQGTLYPGGRIMPVQVKGIDPAQKAVILPTALLGGAGEGDIPAIIGERMAKSSGLSVGDTVTLRWREAGGSFNALDIRIAEIIVSSNPGIDVAQVWIALDTLRGMTRLDGQATLVSLGKDVTELPEVPGWSFKDTDFLLSDIKAVVRSKSIGSTIFYSLLLLLAMLAIFDTQVLSIFRRRREIGMLIAMGMTRRSVIGLFTLEGALHGVLAALLAALYGTPLALLFARKGWGLPAGTEGYGMALGDRLFPVYGVGLVVGTTLLVLTVTTIVSYLPTRRISKLKPTDALRGRTS
jgi:ABC-type lipoprotein release transport system permease subunit